MLASFVDLGEIIITLAAATTAILAWAQVGLQSLWTRRRTRQDPSPIPDEITVGDPPVDVVVEDVDVEPGGHVVVEGTVSNDTEDQARWLTGPRATFAASLVVLGATLGNAYVDDRLDDVDCVPYFESLMRLKSDFPNSHVDELFGENGANFGRAEKECGDPSAIVALLD